MCIDDRGQSVGGQEVVSGWPADFDEARGGDEVMEVGVGCGGSVSTVDGQIQSSVDALLEIEQQLKVFRCKG
ncbi:hypothetical protein GCM10010342_72110 [Streptomyces anulatus]|nr:hypothetical protein GCM10010342_72110 [Streptomyces anulatus]